MPRATTRLAPTPSGYLHEGNAVNLLLVSRLARQLDAEVVLRIDDMDAPRYRPDYVDDIFDVLSWLGITWDRGPRSRADFEARYSLRARTAYYREQLDEAIAAGLPVYACGCSRRQAAEAGSVGCVGDCATAGAALVTGRTALRVGLPGADAVVWRRDGLPAYHLASVIEDRDEGVTVVVRGEDLRESTALQVQLAPFLRAECFASARFVHHPLITGPGGAKLSKSTLGGGPMVRDAASRRLLEDRARAMAELVDIVPPG